jgi:hypothetical protein
MLIMLRFMNPPAGQKTHGAKRALRRVPEKTRPGRAKAPPLRLHSNGFAVLEQDPSRFVFPFDA